jgi:Secretion system C-terminal sorting domain/Metallo-peptidase family M12B Reprolysin-like
MKNINKFWLSMIVIIALCNYTSAQTSLGSSKNFMNKLKTQLVSNSAKGASKAISLKVAEGVKDFEGKINYKKSDATSEFLIGEIKNIPESSFYVKVIDKSLEGHIILKATKEAYKYYSDENGNAYVSKVDINSLICIDYTNVPQNQKSQPEEKPVEMKIAAALLNLQSLPGAAGCVMLDFDGYNMPAGNLWNGGNAINAAGSGMSDAAIQQHWEIVAEDYRPFNINITTNEAVFNSYPKNRRMRVVITTTKTAAPGSGGVAYIGSFNWNNDVPCWVFNLGGKYGGDTSSHEIGHTFDLQHDGRTSPSEAYFAGLGGTPWGPIMGASFSRPVAQWSKGEYNNSNNRQDDVATISGSKFGVGYRGDDYGNTTAAANNLTYNANGDVNQKNGVITNEADLDFFSFTTGGGNVNLNVNTVARDGNLDVIVRLYNSAGAGIGTYTNSTAGALNATLTANLAAGKYFISVDGTGAGDPASGGYSAYASIGSYSITGKIPPAGVATGTATVYQHCAYGGYAITLPVGDYNLGQLQAKGLVNDDMSSLKIQSGYEIVVYQHDGFGGTSLTFTADDNCLIDNGFNDFVSSIRVRARRASSVISNPVVVDNLDIPINAYPNPVETSLSFTKDITNADVEIVNIQVPGSVFKGKVNNNSLDVSNLKSGVYSITIEKDGKSSSTRFIKK